MATTYFKPHHISKGETIAQSMKDRFDYGQNPEKTQGGDLVLENRRGKREIPRTKSNDRTRILHNKIRVGLPTILMPDTRANDRRAVVGVFGVQLAAGGQHFRPKR